MINVYIQSSQLVRPVRRSDLYLPKFTPLPSVSALLDGISGQRVTKESETYSEIFPEEALQSATAHLKIFGSLSAGWPRTSASALVPGKKFSDVRDGPQLSKFVLIACISKTWALAIDRAFDALLNGNLGLTSRLTLIANYYPLNRLFEQSKSVILEPRFDMKQDVYCVKIYEDKASTTIWWTHTLASRCMNQLERYYSLQ